MKDSALDQKLSEISRTGKDSHKLLEHLKRILERLYPNHVPESKEGNADADRNESAIRSMSNAGGSNDKPQKEKFKALKNLCKKLTAAEWIQAVIGFLLLITLLYNTRAYYLSVSTRDMQMRAYLTVTDILNDPLRPGDIRMRIVTKNSGQTPAKSVQVEILHDKPVITGGNGVPDSTVPGIQEPTATSVIGPGSTTFNDEVIHNIGQPIIDELNDGRSHLKLHGTITYVDIFGKTHHT